jgi:ATP-binding cassette subfamily B protein
MSAFVKSPAATESSGLRDWHLFQQLWPFLRPELRPLLVSLGMLPLISLTQAAQPFLVRHAIDGPIARGDWTDLLGVSMAFLGLLAINHIVKWIQMQLSQRTGIRIVSAIRNALYEHLQRLSPRFYQRTPVGKLVTRFTSDVENLSEMLTAGGLAILADIVLIVGGLVGALFMHWRLGLLSALLLGVLILLSEFFRRRSRRAYDAIRVQLAHLNAYAQENLSGIDVVQLYVREAQNLRHFEAENRVSLRHNLSSVFYDSAFSATIELFTLASLILTIAVGAVVLLGASDSWIHGLFAPLSLGQLVAFCQFIQMMFSPVEDVSQKLTIIQSGLASMDKLAVLFQEPPEILSPSHGHDARRVQGEIRFDQVTFGYQAERPVLRDVSFEVRPGQTVAIVGPSGTGKTTVIKLLSRFYDVQGGTIRLDGVDLRDWDLESLRRNVVVIQQEDALFSRTIAENVALATAEEIDPERLWRALDRAHARAWVERLPEREATRLDERGRNLSAGERQLLMFARAFYHDPPVLVLDEATASIDPVTERDVQAAFDMLMEGRTVLVIAHRLTTVRHAHRILFFQHGELREAGTHEALMAGGGAYAAFYESQTALEQRA